MKDEPRERLEAALAYRFRNPGLLRQALSPPSAGLGSDNQRLEFLGDSLLYVCTSLLVYREHPDWKEGALSKLRGMLICTDALAEWAASLGLALEKGPRSPRKPSPAAERKALADALEALLAAVHLDATGAGLDGMAPVMEIVAARCLPRVKAAYPGVWETRDAKTTLQEQAAAKGWAPPVYELVERQGPDHAPSFRVRVEAGGQGAFGQAGTMKGAQTEAARALLGRIQGSP